MASVLKVDKLDPQSGTALEVGTSGDTITVPSGATLTTTNATVNLPASVGGLGTGITNAQLAGSIDVTTKITGVVPPANLGTGTASSSTVLYGDGTFKAEPGGGALSLITAATFGPSSDTFEISSFGSGYDEHKLVIALNYPDSVGSAGYLYLYLSTGGAYVTGKCSYAALASFSHTTGISENKGEEVDFIKCTPDGMREDMWHITIIDFVNLLNTKTKAIRLQDAGSTMDYDYRINNYSGSALLNDSGVTDAIKFTDSQGHNIEGSYQLYGFSKS